MEMINPEMRPIFVFGSGWRSGSTLLQRYINSSGQAFVWGENYDLVRRLVSAFDPILEMDRASQEQAVWHEQHGPGAWTANLNPESKTAIEEALRGALLGYYRGRAQTPRWGFKEVRCHSGHAELLLRLFPQARIVFTVRNPADMLASASTAFWVKEPAQALNLWREIVSRMAAFGDERLLTVRHEDLAAGKDDTLTRIAKHLDIPPDRFDGRVLAHKVRGIEETPRLDTKGKMLLSDRQIIELARLHYPGWTLPSLARPVRQQ